MLKRIVNIFLILIVGIPVMGQTEIKNKSYANRLKFLLSHNVEEISVKDAVAISDKVVFLDSREKSEYNISHIKDAQWVGYDDFDIKRLKTISKDSKIIIYCSVGYRSEKITSKLNKLGYKNVSNLYGGIFEWVNQGNKVYSNDGEVTLKVHTYNKRWGRWLNRGVKVY
ncbi:MAG: rhodanese-like domain-containing protein [Saprospiraceae bacterium]